MKNQTPIHKPIFARSIHESKDKKVPVMIFFLDISGVYKEDGPYDAFVDLSCVAELHSYSVTTPVTVGGAVTLSALQELLASIADKNSDYWYGPILAEHIGKIGSSPLRNVRFVRRRGP